MTAKLIESIIRENVNIITDSEQSAIIVGIERSALKIFEMQEAFKLGNELIKISNKEPKY